MLHSINNFFDKRSVSKTGSIGVYFDLGVFSWVHVAPNAEEKKVIIQESKKKSNDHDLIDFVNETLTYAERNEVLVGVTLGDSLSKLFTFSIPDSDGIKKGKEEFIRWKFYELYKGVNFDRCGLGNFSSRKVGGEYICSVTAYDKKIKNLLESFGASPYVKFVCDKTQVLFDKFSSRNTILVFILEDSIEILFSGQDKVLVFNHARKLKSTSEYPETQFFSVVDRALRYFSGGVDKVVIFNDEVYFSRKQIMNWGAFQEGVEVDYSSYLFGRDPYQYCFISAQAIENSVKGR